VDTFEAARDYFRKELKVEPLEVGSAR
jgi:hypothetical protein